MYLTVKQQVKHLSKEDYRSIKELCHIAKNLTNQAIYNIRQHYFAEGKYLNTTNALALDLGINNLVTGVSSKGETFIIDGRRLKSINQWFNKKNARLQSIKDKQHFGRKTTNRQKALARKRNNRINDYMNKTARRVIDYCIDHDIGTLVVGYNETFQKDSNIGKRNNQTFVNIVVRHFKCKLILQII